MTPQRQQVEEEVPSLPTAVQVPTKPTNNDSNIIQNTPKLLPPTDSKDETLSKPNLVDISDDRPSQGSVAMDLGDGSSVEETLVAKLHWASKKLATATSVEGSTQLCLLIKACAEALKSVRQLDSKPHASILKIQSETNS